MALQDKFDSAFVLSVLKKSLVSSNKVQAVTASNDNSYQLTKSNLITISNSFTSLQNTFNKIYAHTLNVRNLHRYQEKSIASIKRENSLENKIAPGGSPILGTNNAGGSIASSASILDSLASSVQKLNEKMKRVNLSGGGINPSLLNFGGAPSKPMKGGIDGLNSGPLNKRAMGGGVKAGSAYLIGERGPEVLMMGGLSGKVIANGQRGRESQSEKYLMAAANKSSSAAAKVIKGQPPGPTSYSSKFSNYLGSLFGNMPNWINKIKNFLGFGNNNVPDGENAPGGVLGSGQYAAVGDLSKTTGDWKKDTEFISAVNSLAQKYDVDANDLIGLMMHESAGTMNPQIKGKNGATGLFQFMPQFFDTKAIASMSRAQQVQYADKVIFGRNKLPRGANAGQIYAAVFLPGIAQRQGWTGVISRKGDKYYSSNPSLDFNNDDMIDYSDLARVISRHRVRMGLGASPSFSAGANAISSGSIDRTQGGIGTITSVFGMRGDKKHEGIDIAGVPAGTPVAAAFSGVISRADSVMRGYGNTVDIDHGNGVMTRYAHLSAFASGIKVGKPVNAGDIIGGVGNTGTSRGATGIHLHYELRKNGEAVNSLASYKERPWIVGGKTSTTGSQLQEGYSYVTREEAFTRGQKTTVVYVKTPSGYEIPLSAKGTADVASYKGASGNGKREIEAYFRLN